MKPLRLSEIADATSGILAGTPGDAVVERIVIDSRDVRPGDLFVAIVGERFDGHDFVSGALDAGAVAALVSHETPGAEIRVADTVTALGALARHYRDGLSEAVVIGLTGSSGKTSTKDLLAAALPRDTTVAPIASYNNEIGLPRTIFEADSSTRALVLEMGMRGFGHINALCEIAAPDIGLVVNVGSAHLDMVGGTREGIAQAKGELIASLRPGGTAVLNADDGYVLSMRTRAVEGVHVLTFGENESADVRAVDVSLDDEGKARFTLCYNNEQHPVRLGVLGIHQVSNALGAAGAALAAGESLADIAARMTDAPPASRWRLEVQRRSDGVTIINDAYNANPESMRAALRTLVSLARPEHGRTWAVLGAMRELGAATIEEHDAIGRLAVRLDVHRLIAVGDTARVIHLGAQQEGSWDNESAWVPDVDAAIAAIAAEVAPGDVVLVKASRSEGLERVAFGLLSAESGSAS